MFEKESSYGTVPYTKVQAALKQIEDRYVDCPEKLEEVNITFEYLIGSFFPEIIKNIHNELVHEHTKGFAEGYYHALTEEPEFIVGENNEDKGNN
jgi:Tfp pilus assembly protein, pilus retraction ATPase PilT